VVNQKQIKKLVGQVHITVDWDWELVYRFIVNGIKRVVVRFKIMKGYTEI
jgi:hypothetical protein